MYTLFIILWLVRAITHTFQSSASSLPHRSLEDSGKTSEMTRKSWRRERCLRATGTRRIRLAGFLPLTDLTPFSQFV